MVVLLPVIDGGGDIEGVALVLGGLETDGEAAGLPLEEELPVPLLLLAPLTELVTALLRLPVNVGSGIRDALPLADPVGEGVAALLPLRVGGSPSGVPLLLAVLDTVRAIDVEAEADRETLPLDDSVGVPLALLLNMDAAVPLTVGGADEELIDDGLPPIVLEADPLLDSVAYALPVAVAVLAGVMLLLLLSLPEGTAPLGVLDSDGEIEALASLLPHGDGDPTPLPEADGVGDADAEADVEPWDDVQAL